RRPPAPSNRETSTRDRLGLLRSAEKIRTTLRLTLRADPQQREEEDRIASLRRDRDMSPSAPPARLIVQWREFLNWHRSKFAGKTPTNACDPLDRAHAWRQLLLKPRLRALRFEDRKCPLQISLRTPPANYE